jgi:hypothetical protein
MPLTRTATRRGTPAEYRATLRDVVYETFGVGDDDRREALTEHDPETLNTDPNRLGVERSAAMTSNLIELSPDNWSSGDGTTRQVEDD